MSALAARCSAEQPHMTQGGLRSKLLFEENCAAQASKLKMFTNICATVRAAATEISSAPAHSHHYFFRVQ